MATIYVDVNFSGIGTGLAGSSTNPFTSIQAAVDAASPGGPNTVEIAAGTYVEQVKIDGKTDLTLTGVGDVNIEAPADLTSYIVSSSGRETFAVVAVDHSTNVVLNNVNVDGKAVGNTVDEAEGSGQANFVGVYYHQSSGKAVDVNIKGIHDPYPGGDTGEGQPVQSGVQRGVGIQVDNGGSAQLAFEMDGGSISDIQKNATVFNNVNLNVHDVVITGGGTQTIIAQNGIQALNSTGTISNNTISGFGFAHDYSVACAILAYQNTDLNIVGNTITGPGTDSYSIAVEVTDFGTASTGGSVTGNHISDVQLGVDVNSAFNASYYIVRDNDYTGVTEAEYTGTSSPTGASFITDGDDLIYAISGDQPIDGGDGVDTYDLSNAASANVDLDIGTGSGISVSSATGIDTLSNIENVRGSAGNDTIKGSAGDNKFFATTGIDQIDGRGGNDTYDAHTATTSLNVNLNGGAGSVSGAFNGTIVNVENVTTGSGNDGITVTAAAVGNAIDGGAGRDTVNMTSVSYGNATIGWDAANSQFTVSSASGGADTLKGVEVLELAGGKTVFLVHNSSELTAALTSASANDVIKLADGTYAGNFVSNVDGLTIESASGDASKVIFDGTFSESNNLNGTDLDQWIGGQTSYNGSAGAGLTVSGNNVTIKGVTIRDYLSGIVLGGNSDGLTIDGVVIDDSVFGIDKSNGSVEISNFALIGGKITNGYIGMNIAAQSAAGHRGEGSFNGITIDGTRFEHLSQKGIYAEQLSNALIKNIVMNDVGQFGGGKAFGAYGANGAGIDVNLKYEGFSGITITDFTFTDVGLSNGNLGNIHGNASAIAIKARDDGPNYNSPKATLDDVTVKDGIITGTSTGIRVGEPNKGTAGPSDIDIHNVKISGAIVGSYDNQTTTTLTVTLSDDHDSASAISSATGSFHFIGLGGNDTMSGGSQADVFTGGSGNDSITGGGGVDTADGYADGFNVIRDGGAWKITNGAETDTVASIEKVVIDGDVTWLVNNGTELAAAIAAAANGDTIQLAEGEYAGDFAINNKALTILGANHGKQLSDTRGAESVIKGHITINGSEDVTIDGVKMLQEDLAPATVTLLKAIDLLGSGDYTIKNSVFWSDYAGGNKELRGIMLSTAATGHVVIDNNSWDGSKLSGFSGASWQRGIWSDGSTADLDITNNSFKWVRTAVNLDGYDDLRVTVSGNKVLLSAGGDITTGTAFSLGSGTTFAGIHDNDLSGAGSDFNFRNLTNDLTFDASASNNSSTTGIEILSGIGDDDLTGSNGADIISGDGLKTGETGGAAGTFAAAGLGDDTIDALGGNDTVFGQSGKDSIDAGSGADMVDAGADNDRVLGGTGNDTIDAGTGNDSVDGGDDNDSILGGAGNDTLLGGNGTDSIDGGADNDSISGGAGVDTLLGSNGDDILNGGGANDSIDGGTGTDILKVTGTVDVATGIALSGNVWTITSTDGSDSVSNVEKIEDGSGHNILLVGAGGFASIKAALNAAADGDTILVAPGSYTENDNYQGSALGLVIDKSVNIRGISSTGALIGEGGTPVAHVTSGSQSNWGTNFFVTADNVTITGLDFIGVPSSGTELNKVIEVVGNGFTLQYSRVGAGDGIDVGSSIYINDQFAVAGPGFVSHITDYTIDGNTLEGTLVVTNGPGTGHAANAVHFSITDNDFVMNTGSTPDYNWGILLNGAESTIPWRLASILLPAITGNSFTDDYKLLFRALDDDPAKMPTRAYIDSFLANNDIPTYGYATTGGQLKVDAGAANRFYVFSTVEEAIGAADAGDTVVFGVEDDTTLVINTDDLAFDLTKGSGVTLSLATGINNVTLAGDAEVAVTGNSGNNHIVGNAGVNFISAGTGDDTVEGNGGSESLNGGGGNDTVVFDQDYTDYEIGKLGSNYTVTLGDETTIVSQFESFKFNNGTFAASNALVSAGPTFTTIPTKSVAENTALNAVVHSVNATDANTSVGDSIHYVLEDGDGNAYAGPFSIDASGNIRVAGALDYEGIKTYSFVLKVTDDQGHEKSQVVTVNLTDLDDNSPVFSSATSTSINENIAANSTVYTAIAEDPDTFGPVTYSFGGGADDGKFSINSSNGQVKINAIPDFESQGQYTIVVRATQNGVSTDRTVTINVNDLNDNNPVFSSGASVAVNENVAANSLVYTAVASDVDTVGGAITYSLNGTDKDAFTIDEVTGQVRIKASPNFETKASYAITVTATQGTTSTDKAVVINVNDLNDTNPVFSSGASAAVNENVAANSLVYTAVANDVDTVGGAITYSLKGVDKDAFTIDEVTGQVRVKASPNFEAKASYAITVTATQGTTSTDKAVLINVNDLNDNNPVFSSGASVAVNENVAANSLVYTAVASDVDTVGGAITYSLNGTDKDAFTIDEVTGQVRIKASPNFETKASYAITVTATQGTTSTDKAVVINVNDLNDTNPEFTSGNPAAVDENVAANTVVYTATAEDVDTVGGAVVYSLKGADKNAFTIDSSTGVIKIKASPNFETKSSYAITVTATQGSTSTDKALVINVNDLNDNSPVFTSGSPAAINENVAANAQVYNANASDADLSYGPVVFSLKGADKDAFTIDSSNGIVRIKASPDFETKSSYAITVTATQGSTATDKALVINVNDLNDNNPVFASGNPSSVDENVAANTVVYTAVAADADASYGAITYSLKGADKDAFTIDSSTGVVKIKASPNFETKSSYAITVTATQGSTSTDKPLVINVNDLNDNNPVFTSGGTASVNENAALSTVVYDANATDADSSATFGNIVFSLTGTDASLFNIDGSNGQVTLKSGANFESKATYNFGVVATQGTTATTKAVVLTVKDVNEGISTAAQGVLTKTFESGTTKSALGALNDDATVLYDVQTFDLGGGKIYKADGTALKTTDDLSLADLNSLKFSSGASSGSITFLAHRTGSADTETFQISLQVNPAVSKTYTGTSSKDTIDGAGGNDRIDGLGGADVLIGSGGKDTLDGGTGNDTLTGGSSADHFLFNVKASSNGVDTITDFAQGTDKLVFSSAFYSALGAEVTTSEFRTNTTGLAADSSDNLILNAVTGDLYYDKDGKGGADGVKIAHFDTDPNLALDDFLII